MNQQLSSQSTKERVSTHLYFGSLYFLTVGVLFLWGYWVPFGINILEYLDLSDIVKATAYPIAAAVLMTAIGAALAEISITNQLPRGGGEHTRAGRLLRRFASFLGAVYVLLTLGLILYAPAEKWTLLPALIAAPIAYYVKQTKFLLPEIPHDSVRSVAIFVLVVMPSAAFGVGQITAEKIRTGRAFMYAISDFPGYPISAQVASSLRFVGHAGDFIFFYDPKKDAMVIGKLDGEKPLVLKRHEGELRSR